MFPYRSLGAIVAIIILLFSLNSCNKDNELPVDFTKRGTINESTLLYSFSQQQVDSLFESFNEPLLAAINPAYGLDLYKVQYNTPDARGNKMTIASGLVVIPTGTTEPMAIASYQHGTIIKKDRVPSSLGGEYVINIIFSGLFGIVTVAPDYLGLGDSPGLHPYVHADSEASAGIDMLRATTNFSKELQIDVTDEVLLFGYSQGGHATTAIHRELEANHKDEFTVLGAAPMAGPYDMSGYQSEIFTSGEPYTEPFYLPYVLLSYNMVYQIYDDPSDFLAAPYDELLPPMFDGTNSGNVINDVMPTLAKSIIKPEVLTAFQSNYDHPFKIALKKNNMYFWTPEAPVFLCHCEGDEQVKFENSLIAYNAFRSRQSPDIRLKNNGNSLHQDCAPSCISDVVSFFTELLQ